ncbi:MAG: cytochrome C oxidase subunit IV family protein [Pseudomonadota bacterium]|nr:cytochrome C oxidase subunit IV family protein [Pseudomonadota bacterium]
MGKAEKTWLLLVVLTLVGALLAETSGAGWPLALAVAGAVIVKGGLVIDHYMEMSRARASFRRALYVFSGIIAVMVLLTHEFGETIERITTIY